MQQNKTRSVKSHYVQNSSVGAVHEFRKLGGLTDVNVKGQQKNPNFTAKTTPTKVDQQISNNTS